MRFKSVCAVLLLGVTVHTAQGKLPGQVKNEREIQRGGVIVVVDPATRQIREATPDEIGAFSPPVSAQAAPPVVIQGPDGSVGVILTPEHQVYAVATKTAGGKVHIDEVTGPNTASGFMPAGQDASPASAK